MSEIVKNNGKSFGKVLAAIALTGLLILNIGFSVDVSFEDGWMPNVELSATAQTMMAEDPSSGTSEDCTSTDKCGEAGGEYKATGCRSNGTICHCCSARSTTEGKKKK